MSGIFLRWGVPALVTVVGGTSLAISATSGDIAADLQHTRGHRALDRAISTGHDVDFDAPRRDPHRHRDRPADDRRRHRAGREHPRRPLGAARMSFSRSSSARSRSPPTVKTARSRCRAGCRTRPLTPRSCWRPARPTTRCDLFRRAAARAVATRPSTTRLAHLAANSTRDDRLAGSRSYDQRSGEIPGAFDQLRDASQEPLPAGVTVAKREIIPALASPFAVARRIRRHARGGLRLHPERGVRRGDAERRRRRAAGLDEPGPRLRRARRLRRTARLLLENLVRLEEGKADISDGTATLSGAPADAATIEAVRLAMTPTGVDARSGAAADRHL